MPGPFPLPPAAADLTARFPTFAAADPAVLTAALTEAAARVDTTWTPGDYLLGVMLYAAHVLTLDGLGTGAEAALNAAGAGDFTTLRSGSLHLERAAPPAGKGGAGTTLGQTGYGRRFLALLRVNAPAVLVP